MESLQASTPNQDVSQKGMKVPRGLGRTAARVLTAGQLRHYRGIPGSATRLVEDYAHAGSLLKDFALGNEPPLDRTTQGAMDTLENRGANVLTLPPEEIPRQGPFNPRPQA